MTIDDNRVHYILQCLADDKPISRGAGITTALLMYTINHMFDNRKQTTTFITSHNVRWHCDHFEYILKQLYIPYKRSQRNQFKLYTKAYHGHDFVGRLHFNRNVKKLYEIECDLGIASVVGSKHYNSNFIYDLPHLQIYKGIRAWFN